MDKDNIVMLGAVATKAEPADSVSEMARKFADAVEANEFGEVYSAMVIVRGENGQDIFAWGSDVRNNFEAIAAIELGKQQLVLEALNGG